jgi:hypothetical protein
MSERPYLSPGDLTSEELQTIVERIQDALWPRFHEREPQTPAQFREVINVLTEYNLDPGESR